MTLRLAWLKQALGRLLGDCRGVSAVEFAVLAPFVMMGVMSTIDLGRAIHDKMMIGQVLRTGAHKAILAGSEAEVLTMLRAVAGDNFSLSATPSPGAGELGVAVTSYCVCPVDTGVTVGCSSSCSTGTPIRFYALSATKLFDGVFLPSFSLNGTIDVAAQ